MNFTAKDVQGLRERTGAGMMDCKKALVETNGDVEKAIDYLREKGLAKAAKKEGRIAAEGLVEEYHNENCAALVEVNCETDFVAKTDRFKSFVKMIAKQVVIHLGGSRGVLVQFAAPSDPEAMHDVALQIAAASPVCVDVASLPQEFIDHERAVQLATAKEENAQSAKPKPDAIVEKMVEGRMQKYYKEVCLMEQQFVKNPDITIKDMLKAKNASKVLAFVRFEKGEGIEKRQENFADEIAKMTK